MIKHVEKTAKPDTLFFFGHSMGASALVTLFINNPYTNVNGLILSAPLLNLPINLNLDYLRYTGIMSIGNELEEIILNGMINPHSLAKCPKHIVRVMTDTRNLPLSGVKTTRNILKK